MLPKICIICCRFSSESENFAQIYSPTNDEETDDDESSHVPEAATLRRFFHLLERYLSDNIFCSDEGVELFPLENLIAEGGMFPCRECSKLVDSFSDLYHQMKYIELALNWKVKSLKNIMLGAQRMPIRMKRFRECVKQFGIGDVSPDEIMDFKEDLIKKCRRKLQTSFPRLKLKKCKPRNVNWLPNSLSDNANCEDDQHKQLEFDLGITIKQDIIMDPSIADVENDDAYETIGNQMVVETSPEIFIPPAKTDTHEMVEHAITEQDALYDCSILTLSENSEKLIIPTNLLESQSHEHFHENGSVVFPNLNENMNLYVSEISSFIDEDGDNELSYNLNENENSNNLNGNKSWTPFPSDLNHTSFDELDTPVEELEIGEVKVAPAQAMAIKLNTDEAEHNQRLMLANSDVLSSGEMISDYSTTLANESSHIQIEDVTEGHDKRFNSSTMTLPIGEQEQTNEQIVSLATEIKETLPLSIIAPLPQSPNECDDLLTSFTNPVTNRHQCLICHKDFKYKHGFNRHYQKHHLNVRYKCTICEIEFGGRDEFGFHHRSEHLGVRYRCNICHGMFKRPCQLKKHFQSKHSGQEYFQSQDAFDVDQVQPQQIIDIQSPDEEFINESKNRLFTSLLRQPLQQDNNQARQDNHHNPTSTDKPSPFGEWACKLCGINFMFKGNLQLHMEVVHCTPP